MSRLEELIQELCPDGVEYKFLKECCELSRGDYITKKSAKLGNIPVILGGQEPAYYIDKANHYGKAIVISRSGASAGFVSYWDEPIFVTDGFIIEAKQELDIRFLYYFLKNMQIFINTMKKGGGVPHITGKNLLMIKIPIPPLPVQSEIVRILDSFTEVTAQLQEQLALEVTARRKQYEYYRDKLLTFDATSGVAWRTVGEIATVTKLAGFEFTKYVTYSEEGNIIALRGLNVKNGKLNLEDVKYIDNSDLTKLTRSKLHIGDMLFTYVGTIGQVALIDENDRYYLAPNVALIRVDSSVVLPRFLQYYFQSTYFWNTQINRLLQSSSMKNIPMEKIRRFGICIPPLEVQQYVVAILDRFDALCNDLASGLPAEIEARKKQYEYYRDKLLSFKERAP